MSELNVKRISSAKKLGKQPITATLMIRVTVEVRSHHVASVNER